MKNKSHNHLIYNILFREKHKKSYRSKDNPEFESTSIGDLAFLLLIFFIVTGSFVLRQGILFSLPSKSAGTVQVDEKKLIEVFPINDGFQIDNKTLTRQSFKDVLSSRQSISKDNILVIYMSKTVKYSRLIDTLSVAKETGITRVSLKDTEE